LEQAGDEEQKEKGNEKAEGATAENYDKTDFVKKKIKSATFIEDKE
jgi:hypothetical protein